MLSRPKVLIQIKTSYFVKCSEWEDVLIVVMVAVNIIMTTGVYFNGKLVYMRNMMVGGDEKECM